MADIFRGCCYALILEAISDPLPVGLFTLCGFGLVLIVGGFVWDFFAGRNGVGECGLGFYLFFPSSEREG